MKIYRPTLILIVILYFHGCFAVKFKKTPTNITAIEGGTVMLRCRFSQGSSRLKRTWMKGTSMIYADSNKYSNDRRISLDFNNQEEYSLQLSRVTVRDEGVYTCTLYHSSPMTMSIYLKVNVPAQFTSDISPDVITLDENEKTVLTCSATGKPKPKITWRHLVPSADGIRGTGPYLPLTKISREGSGFYECTADNKIAAPVTHRIEVVVKYPPELNKYKSMPVVSQALGKETVLECSASAVPEPTFTWRHYGKLYSSKLSPSSGRISILNAKTGNTVTSKLYITIVALDDFGEYVCIAQNEMGKANRTVILKRFIPEETRPPPSVIFSKFQNQQASDNGDKDGNSALSTKLRNTIAKLFTLLTPMLGVKIVNMFHI